MFPVEGFAGRDTGAVSSQSRGFIPSRFSLPVPFRVIALCQGQALDCGSPDTFIHLDRYRCSCRWFLTCALCKLVCANFFKGAALQSYRYTVVFRYTRFHSNGLPALYWQGRRGSPTLLFTRNAARLQPENHATHMCWIVTPADRSRCSLVSRS